MGFASEQEQAKVRAARRFQMNAELREIRLLDCSASVADSVEWETGELRLGIRLDPTVLKTEPGSGRFAVRIKVFGDWKEADGGEERPHLMEVACLYAPEYSLKPGYVPSEQEIEAFSEGNAVFHCWPFFREFVYNVTMRMNLRLPPLPLLRLVPKPEPKRVRVKKATAARKSSGGNDQKAKA